MPFDDLKKVNMDTDLHWYWCVARDKDASGIFIVQALGPYSTVCNAPFMLVTFTKLCLIL